jgi:hypothetical protein
MTFSAGTAAPPQSKLCAMAGWAVAKIAAVMAAAADAEVCLARVMLWLLGLQLPPGPYRNGLENARRAVEC